MDLGVAVDPLAAKLDLDAVVRGDEKAIEADLIEVDEALDPGADLVPFAAGQHSAPSA